MIKILWIDDQINVVTTFSHLLEPLGAEIDYQPDGEKALNTIKKKSYDIALVDLAMPPGKWGGLWFLRELKNLGINLPIIIVSGEGNLKQNIEAQRMGYNAYLEKENLSNELLNMVKTELKKNLNNEQDMIREIIKNGESDNVEFKATLRWDIKQGKNNANLELSVLKTIAAFINTKGGTLIIGVDDKNGEILGLDNDNFSNDDKFQLYFWDKLISQKIGSQYAEYIAVEFIPIDNKKVFVIKCRQNLKEPVYVTFDGIEYFYVRTGNRTESFSISKAHKYINNHFRN